MRSLTLVISFALLAGGASFSQTSTFVKDNVRHTVAWEDLLDSVVDVDGLAWGAFEKGLGARLVLPHDKVYLQNVDLGNTDLNGRLLRISGILRKGRVAPAPRGSQGYGQAFEYFYIEAIAVERIDKLERGQLLPSQAHWITPGMKADDAANLIRAQNYEAYGLSLTAAKDGSKAHAFKLDDQHVLVYFELDGMVRSIARIDLQGIGKGDEKWHSLPAFRLPAVSTNAG